MKVLVTGGAGFVGSHIVDALIEQGHRVRILDNLDPQVHGKQQQLPDYLNPKAEFVRGDVCNAENMWQAMRDVDVVFHKAARVGVGQSMYEVAEYTRVNVQGTALFLDLLVNRRSEHKIRKIVVASSMSIYGEGLYRNQAGQSFSPPLRPQTQLEAHQWEMRGDPADPSCELEPCPTDESKPLLPTSIYAINKRDQEEMFLSIGRAYQIPAVALRYFNIYGPRQALSNPYTGVAAIFSSRILNGNAPVVYEDGLQSRDFIHVSDIVQANLLAMENSAADYQVFNVGTGKARSILAVGQALCDRLNPDAKLIPQIVNKFRSGDIRHCYADISRITAELNFKPKVDFDTDGLDMLCEWARGQQPVDHFEEANAELNERGLT